MITFPKLEVYFGLAYQPGAFFTLDDPVRGVLNNSTYRLAADVGIDISQYLTSFTIRRGRSIETDEFNAGTLSAEFENWDRALDALNVAGAYFGDLRAGKRVVVSMYGIPLMDARTEEWESTWPVNGMPMAHLDAVDELGALGRRAFDAWTTTAGEAPGTRIAASLDRAEVAFGANRDLDAGYASLQGDPVTWDSNVLNYLQLVTKSEGGRLFVTRNGTLTFRDRRSLVGRTVSVAFRDDLTATDFHGVETISGSRMQVNRVGVDREGGTLQTVESDADTSEDGVRAMSLPKLLLDSDAQSLDMANYLLTIYKDPATRVSSITVNIGDLPEASKATVAGLDIGDVVSIVWKPNAVGASVSQTLAVDGVDHFWTNGLPHIMTIHTTPVFQQAVFILGDPLWGVLDTGPGRLAF